MQRASKMIWGRLSKIPNYHGICPHDNGKDHYAKVNVFAHQVLKYWRANVSSGISHKKKLSCACLSRVLRIMMWVGPNRDCETQLLISYYDIQN